MASEIRVNTINNRSGLGTVSITDTGLVVSGIITATSIDTSSTSTFSSGLNVTGGSVGIGTRSPSSIAHIRQSLAGAQLTLDSAAGFGFNIRAINNTSNNTLGLYGTRSAGTGSSGIDVVIGSTNTRSSGRAIMQVQNNGTSLLHVDAGGDVQIANGNLVFSTSGTGIDFSATADGSGTATSELLDDYEEGTWTPGVTDGTNTGSLSAVQCRYTKIGRLVYVRGSLLNINTTGMTAGSTIIVTGLPYALQPNNVNATLAFPVGTNLITTTKGVVAVVDRNSTNMVFHEVDNAVGGTTIKVSALTSGNADIYIGFSYESA